MHEELKEILTIYKDKRGYLYEYWLCVDGSTKQAQHRRVWEEYHNQLLPKGYDVHHLDGDLKNNKSWNLLAVEHSIHTLMFHDIRYKVSIKGWEKHACACCVF